MRVAEIGAITICEETKFVRTRCQEGQASFGVRYGLSRGEDQLRYPIVATDLGRRLRMINIGEFARVKVGITTVNEVERMWGPGLTVTGAHPHGARIWIHDGFRQKPIYLFVDGFRLVKSASGTWDIVVEHLLVSTLNPHPYEWRSVTRHHAHIRNVGLFSHIHIGNDFSVAIAFLRRAKINFSYSSGTVIIRQSVRNRVRFYPYSELTVDIGVADAKINSFEIQC